MSEIVLDVVTPTANRAGDLLAQAAALGPQLAGHDRWIVVDDASVQVADVRELARRVPSVGQLLFVALSYAKGEQVGTVNRARHAGCSLARLGAWIVEVDDHDIVMADCLESIRVAIRAGGVFVYGDLEWVNESGQSGAVCRKPDYTAWMVKHGGAVGEGVRAFPKALYELAGGYRWHGEPGIGGNEFPAGDYCLQVRMEEVLDGKGFHRVPKVLCRVPKVAGGISTRYIVRQTEMARAMRRVAAQGKSLER